MPWGWGSLKLQSTIVCPQCGAEVESQFGFGMVTCSQCGHLFMSEGAVLQMEPGEEKPTSVADYESIPLASEPIHNFSEDSLVEKSSPQPFPQNENVETQQINLNDIAEFGNTPIEASGSGALHYSLEITGIDTPELKQELEDVLQDKRLGVPVIESIKKIKDGMLKIENINPVKASVIVSRLKNTKLKVAWSTKQMIKVLSLLFAVLFSQNYSMASDWDRHEGSLKQTAIKINNLQEEIHEMALKSKKEEDPLKKDEVLLEVKKKYTELRQAYKDLQQEIDHVRFEHPERGDKTTRQYKHIKVKTLEELEGATSLEGQMGKVKRKAIKQYEKQ